MFRDNQTRDSNCSDEHPEISLVPLALLSSVFEMMGTFGNFVF